MLRKVCIGDGLAIFKELGLESRSDVGSCDRPRTGTVFRSFPIRALQAQAPRILRYDAP